MQLTITTDTDAIVTVDLDPADPVTTLQAVLEAETGVPAAQQLLVHNGGELAVGGTLGAAGVQPNDLLFLQRRVPAVPRAAPAAVQQQQQAAGNPMGLNPDGSAVDPQRMMGALAANPAALANLPPQVADAVRTNDTDRFQAELRGLVAAKRAAAAEEERLYRLAQEDPFNPELQRHLMEAAQAKNVAENFEIALEHNPEAFASVCMLYVNMEVNGFPLKAFIDSGAQMTIMSRSCAERCNLLHLMDKRWQGMAVGVGKAKILGRIHMVQVKAGAHFFPVSITVLDQDGMEFLFGLENLKRHQCCIDLKDNVLRFASTGDALPFLAEHEIPAKELGGSQAEGDSQQAGGSSAGPGASAPGEGCAPAAQPPAAAPPASAPGGGLLAGWEERLAQLQSLGFPRDQCLQALRSTGGNADLAASLLFGAM